MGASRENQSNTIGRDVKAVYGLHCRWWSSGKCRGCLGKHPTSPPGTMAGSPTVHVESIREEEEHGTCSLSFVSV